MWRSANFHPPVPMPIRPRQDDVVMDPSPSQIQKGFIATWQPPGQDCAKLPLIFTHSKVPLPAVDRLETQSYPICPIPDGMRDVKDGHSSETTYHAMDGERRKGIFQGMVFFCEVIPGLASMRDSLVQTIVVSRPFTSCRRTQRIITDGLSPTEALLHHRPTQLGTPTSSSSKTR